LQEEIDVSDFELVPHGFLLAWTREQVNFPPDARIAARVEGKSSLGRIGVGVHVTAPTIHAGFRGPIQLELVNQGPHVIVLDAGMRICQLILEQTFGTPEKGYSGMFFDQKS
jgi:dCTP deaminase